MKILEKRIEHFISSSEIVCANNPDIKPLVENSVSDLRRNWNDLRNLVTNTKNGIEDTKQYYALADHVRTQMSGLFNFYDAFTHIRTLN